MYESPITKIYGEIHDEIIRKDEDHLMTVVTQNVGYQVDRNELIKALQYDRDQYRKGYLDCKRKVLEQEPKVKNRERLTNAEWVDFLSEQFNISRTSAKEMLHVMMSVKKEDNFKKPFSQG